MIMIDDVPAGQMTRLDRLNTSRKTSDCSVFVRRSFAFSQSRFVVQISAGLNNLYTAE